MAKKRSTAESTYQNLTGIAERMKVLGDPSRLFLLHTMVAAPAPLTVTELVERMDRLSQPTVSHHLRLLAQTGFVEREKRGVNAFYSVNRDALDKFLTQELPPSVMPVAAK